MTNHRIHPQRSLNFLTCAVPSTDDMDRLLRKRQHIFDTNGGHSTSGSLGTFNCSLQQQLNKLNFGWCTMPALSEKTLRNCMEAFYLILDAYTLSKFINQKA
jgi:hypothetical protein